MSQSKMAYKSYQEKFSGPRWEALVKRGAKKQRLLLASTGAKNPNYPDTIYIDSLIGPGTVRAKGRVKGWRRGVCTHSSRVNTRLAHPIKFGIGCAENGREWTQ